MGAGSKFPYPKWVWTPYGGWWCEPPNWRANTAIAMAGLFVTLGCIFSLSASVERRPNPPVRPIPSEAWSKWAIVDRANGEARKTCHLKGAPYAMLSMRRTTYPITAENSVSDAQFDPHAGRVAPSDALFGNAAAAAARGRPDSEAVALPRSLNDDRSEPQPEHQPNNLRR